MKNLIHDLLARILPTTNATALARLAGIPAKAITKHYAWVDGKNYGVELQPKHYLPLVAAISEANGGTVMLGLCEARVRREFVSITFPNGDAHLMGADTFAKWCQTGEII